MLIEFSATNFKSIRETQTLSMVASSASELREENSFTVLGRGIPPLLRSAVIYGPNASGKSNLLDAVQFMDKFVTESSKKGQEGETIGVTNFKFNADNRTEPSEFEVLFLQEGVRYQYGFSVNRDRVIHEWLIAYPEGPPQRWFEREFNKDTGEENWFFGSKLKGRKVVLQEATRSNALFLSTAVQLNNEQLKPVYNWFKQKLRMIGVDGLMPVYSTKGCDTEANKKRILELLNAGDLSIADIEVEMMPFDSTKLPSDMPEPLKDVIKKNMDGMEIPEIKFLHEGVGTDGLIALDHDDESAGTKKLFSLAGPWLDLLDNGRVLFVDELNNSMHPLMVRFLISLVNNSKINKKNAQLIFSTHDTSTLDNELF
ncbi:MAG: ATP-binding protein, partial [Thermodesulfobacteriota bacterium]|nr:ATP-binding protein [Thermodesulfobacteriota bacterium]